MSDTLSGVTSCSIGYNYKRLSVSQTFYAVRRYVACVCEKECGCDLFSLMAPIPV